MSSSPVPAGYHTVTPYLLVGDVAAELRFLTAAFDAKEKLRMEGEGGKLNHAEVQIGDSPVMMGCAGERCTAMPCMLYLYVADADALYRKALEAGATSIQEPALQPYGDRTCAVQDAFGNQWWIATHVEDVSPEEIERRVKERA